MLFYEKVMKTYTYGILNRNHYELEIISWGLLCEEGWGEFPKGLNVYDCKRGYRSVFAEIVRSLIFPDCCTAALLLLLLLLLLPLLYCCGAFYGCCCGAVYGCCCRRCHFFRGVIVWLLG